MNNKVSISKRNIISGQHHTVKSTDDGIVMGRNNTVDGAVKNVIYFLLLFL